MKQIKGIKGINIGQMDLIKGILMAFFILAHSVNLIVPIYKIDFSVNFALRALDVLYKLVLCSGVPVFFMICGYFAKKRDMKSCVKSQLSFFIKPYLLVAVFVTLATVLKCLIVNGDILQGLEYSSLPFLLGWCPAVSNFHGITMNDIGPVWFFFTYTFGSILLNAVLHLKKTWMQVAAIAMLGMLGIKLCGRALPFCIQQTLICTGFMYAGWLIKSTKIIREDIPLPAIILLLLFSAFFVRSGYVDISQNVWTQGVTDLIVCYMVSFGLFMLFIRIKRPSNKFGNAISWIGWNALDICCIHTVFYLAFPWHYIVDAFKSNIVIGLIVTIILQFALVVLCLIAIKALRKSIGRKKKGTVSGHE